MSPSAAPVASTRSGGDVGRPGPPECDDPRRCRALPVHLGSGPQRVRTDGHPRRPRVPPAPGRPRRAGPIARRGRAHGRGGGTTEGTYDLGTIGVGPSAALVGLTGPFEAGRPLSVGLQIVGGTGPFDWSIEPSTGVQGVAAGSGTVATGVPVNWSGVRRRPGRSSSPPWSWTPSGGSPRRTGP